MTTPNPGAALADELRLILENNAGRDHVPAHHVLHALTQYDRASQVEGERVRATLLRRPTGGQYLELGTVHSSVHEIVAYIEFPLPPRTTPPTVEGSVVDG